LISGVYHSDAEGLIVKRLKFSVAILYFKFIDLFAGAFGTLFTCNNCNFGV